jgi:hypothetical protein
MARGTGLMRFFVLRLKTNSVLSGPLHVVSVEMVSGITSFLAAGFGFFAPPNAESSSSSLPC